MRPILTPPFERALLQPVPRLPASLLRLASDERLVALARSGSEAAFAAIFERHHRPLLAFCRHMLGSAEEAEDAVQHTFLAAYRSLSASTRAIDLRPWLFSIARNRCLSVLRATRARSRAEPPEIATEHLSAEVQRRQDLRDLLADLARLPDEQREALVLSEVGALTHAQVAEVIGVRREKVKSLVFQARASLIASREARETPCREIREAIATERGRALRRSNIRRHVRDCAGCKEFGDAVARQRRMLAAVLPVAPSLALKSTVLGGVAGGGAGAAGAGATVTTAKAIIAVAIASGGTAAGVEIAQRQDAEPSRPAAAAEAAPAPARSAPPRRPRTTGSPALALPDVARQTTRERREAARARDRGVRRRGGEAEGRRLRRTGSEGKPDKHADGKRPGRGGPTSGKQYGRREPSGRGQAVSEPRVREERSRQRRRSREKQAVLKAPAPKAPNSWPRGEQRPAASATPVPATLVPVEPTPPLSDAEGRKG